MTIEIYFADLKESVQKEVLDACNITKPEDANWDVFPIATIDVPSLDEIDFDID